MIDITDKILAIFRRDNYRCQHWYLEENHKGVFHSVQCPVNGLPNIECTHLIAKTKANKKYVIEYYKRWAPYFTETISYNYYEEKIMVTHTTYPTLKADDIIHHPLNLKTSCRRHNDYFNIGNKPVERDKLLDEIWRDLNE